MAIIILGKSKCILCDQVIHEEDDIVAFTHFLPRTHSLWKYSDAAFHRGCLELWEHKEEFEKLYSAVREAWASRPPIPEGMTFTEFEKTDAYREFCSRMDSMFLDNV